MTAVRPQQRISSEIRAPGTDPRASSSPPLGLPLVPTSVLVLSLDEALVDTVRQELSEHCAVRGITAATELAGAVVTSGDRLVVLIDAGLPSIDLPAFAGLAPILPASARVVVWGSTPMQHARLSAMFPITRKWIVDSGTGRPGELLLSLPTD